MSLRHSVANQNGTILQESGKAISSFNKSHSDIELKHRSNGLYSNYNATEHTYTPINNYEAPYRSINNFADISILPRTAFPIQTKSNVFCKNNF